MHGGCGEGLRQGRIVRIFPEGPALCVPPIVPAAGHMMIASMMLFYLFMEIFGTPGVMTTAYFFETGSGARPDIRQTFLS